VNIEIVKTFVKLHRLMIEHGSFAPTSSLERKYDAQFSDVFDAISGWNRL
jgi:hypothetical protein